MKKEAVIQLIDKDGIEIENPIYSFISGGMPVVDKYYRFGMQEVFELPGLLRESSVVVYLMSMLDRDYSSTDTTEYKNCCKLLEWYYEKGLKLTRRADGSFPQQLYQSLNTKEIKPHQEIVFKNEGHAEIKKIIEDDDLLHSLVANDYNKSVSYYVTVLGCNPNQKTHNEHGHTLLMRTTNKETHDNLVSLGADINILDDKGRPLISHVLSKVNDPTNAVANTLINEIAKKYKNNPNGVEGDLKVAIVGSMFSALVSKKMSVLKNLMTNFKKNINEVDADGNNMLHRACEELDYQSITYLLKKGVDPNAVNNEGLTPLLKMYRNGRSLGKVKKTKRAALDKIWDLFLEKGFNFKTANQIGDDFLLMSLKSSSNYDYRPLFSSLIPYFRMRDEFTPFYKNKDGEDFFLKSIRKDRDITDQDFNKLMSEYVTKENIDNKTIDMEYIAKITLMLSSNRSSTYSSYNDNSISKTIERLQGIIVEYVKSNIWDLSLNKKDYFTELVNSVFYQKGTNQLAIKLKSELEEISLSFDIEDMVSQKKTIKNRL